jgi:hypothetical protein
MRVILGKVQCVPFPRLPPYLMTFCAGTLDVPYAWMDGNSEGCNMGTWGEQRWTVSVTVLSQLFWLFLVW